MVHLSREFNTETSIKVGVGGWAYLPIKHASKLKICSRLYDFAEVNSSFYKLPSIESVRKWRRSVPEGFEFTFRANRKLTHENHLEPTEVNFFEFRKNLNLCRELNSNVLHFQFPPNFEVTKKEIQNWRDFFGAVDVRSRSGYFPKIAFEIRNTTSASDLSVESFIRDQDIIPVSDASKYLVRASSNSKVVYSRVFGPGDHTRWSFDSDELEKLKQKIETVPSTKRYITFHNLTMYEDASRMKDIVMTGREQVPQTRSQITTIDRTLTYANLEFPISKESLIRNAGWRTFEDDSGRKVHVGKILEEKLGSQGNFESLDEVLNLLTNN